MRRKEIENAWDENRGRVLYNNQPAVLASRSPSFLAHDGQARDCVRLSSSRSATFVVTVLARGDHEWEPSTWGQSRVEAFARNLTPLVDVDFDAWRERTNLEVVQKRKEEHDLMVQYATERDALWERQKLLGTRLAVLLGRPAGETAGYGGVGDSYILRVDELEQLADMAGAGRTTQAIQKEAE